MGELISPPEQEREIKREEVIAAYGTLVARGFTNPDELDPEDPEVRRAYDIDHEWQRQQRKLVGADRELQHRFNLACTMTYVDAGFTDADYLDEVLKEFLAQDAQDAEKQEDNPQRVETRRQIAEATNKVRRIIRELK